MSCFVVMAVRPVDEGKSRLAEVLNGEQRKSLNIRMFRHVLRTVMQVFPPERIVVVSRSESLLEEVRSHGATGLMESGNELNTALLQGSRLAVDRGATELLTLNSDLPFLHPDDIRALLAAEGDAVIATDRIRVGTNALLVRRPLTMAYRYGGESLAAHRASAAEAGLTITVLERSGLARDIDTPDDLSELG